MNGKLRALCVCSILTVGASTALLALPGRGILYGSDGQGGDLLTVDPATGVGTLVGQIAGGTQIRSLATDPATGVLYAGSGGNVGALLYSVDPGTGVGTLVGDTGLGQAMISGMDFSWNGVLYASVNLTGSGGTGGDNLVTIDPATGHATLVGAFGTCTGVTIPSTGTGTCTIEGIEGLAFDPSGALWGVLRGSAQSSGSPGLYRIDTATGQATFVVPVRDAAGDDQLVTSLQFACDGTLYAGTGGAGPPTPADTAPPATLIAGSLPATTLVGYLATIDPATGLLTYVGGTSATNGDDLSGLAFSDVCSVVMVPALDPASLALLGLLLLAGGWFVLARRPPRRRLSA